MLRLRDGLIVELIAEITTKRKKGLEGISGCSWAGISSCPVMAVEIRKLEKSCWEGLGGAE